MRPIDPEIVMRRAHLEADLAAAREARRVTPLRWMIRIALFIVLITEIGSLIHH